MVTKIEASDNRAYIEEMLRDSVPLRIIEGRLKDVYGEEISRTALARHRDKYVTHGTEGKDVGTVEKEACQDKGVTNDAEEPLSEMDALKRRVKALELVAWWNASTVSYTGWDTFSINGKKGHNLTYKNIVEECMPDTHNLEDQYKHLVASIQARRIKALGEPLTDEFVQERADLAAKRNEEAKIASAEAEIKESMAKKQAAQNKITNLSEERIQEIKDNDAAAAKYVAEKEAREEIEALEAQREADLKEIEDEAEVMMLAEEEE